MKLMEKNEIKGMILAVTLTIVLECLFSLFK